MAHEPLHRLTIEELSPLLRQKTLSPVEVVEHYLSRIEQLNPQLRAYVTVLGDSALAEARRCEAEIMAGDYRGPLHGVPIALKDLFDTAGIRTTAGSRVFAERIPGEDATSVKRLRAAGAIVLGKTNLHEFAFGSTGEISYGGPTRNPWMPQRIPGGSSSGSGAAVAAGLCVAATGSDTGGSIRIPGALCGVMGLKPTFGRVSCAGVVPLSWTLDHVGFLTRSAYDAAVMLGTTAGWDVLDPATLNAPVPDYTAALGEDVRGLRIAIDPDYTFACNDPEVASAFNQALDVLQGLRMHVNSLKVQSWDSAREAARVVMDAEAAALHESFLETRADDYLPNGPRLRLESGLAIRGVDYARAQRVRQQSTREFELLFEAHDLIALPTCPITATPFGQVNVTLGNEVVPVAAALIRFTRVFNLLGLPAITVPCGFSSEGLPIGLQLVGRLLEEAAVLRAAHAYERATAWRQRSTS
jgi:aspartyl-tRNA(Asn)/glutamyl-tRNA(Gln) amidotransferase subunit A